MDKIKNSDLSNVALELSILGNVTITGRLSLAVVNFTEKVHSQRKSIDLARIQLLKGYAKTDKKSGELLKTNGTKAIFKSKDDEDKYYVEYGNLMNEDSGLSYPTVDTVDDEYLESLEVVTPAQLMVLKKFKSK